MRNNPDVGEQMLRDTRHHRTRRSLRQHERQHQLVAQMRVHRRAAAVVVQQLTAGQFRDLFRRQSTAAQCAEPGPGMRILHRQKDARARAR